MEKLVGTVLNNTYRIDRLLGQGGMGAVFLAHDVALNRDVAIKLMHSHIAMQQGFRERFLQEARALAALSHPGIVPIYSFSSDPQQLYLVMAYVAGQNLADWLHLLHQRQQTIALPEALGIVELVAEALDYAHRHGVYHRDIKPGNIILKPLEAGQTNAVGLSFQPVVTDFGLAKLAEGGVQSMAGLSMGTPAYMAPEQCEAKPVDGRADIYALGIVLYELVTGRVPFAVSTLTEALQAHTQEPPPPPRQLVAELPTAVERIILQALAKRPEDRYQTASAMAEAIHLARSSLSGMPLEATITPTGAGHASLMTLMAQEAPPSAPQDAAWPTPPSDLEGGPQLLVLGPDGRSTAIAFGSRRALTIGRDPANNVALNDTQVSRQHCQVSIDNGRFFITDLNSTNGTYLGDNKLLPGVAEPWRPGQSVRVGSHWLRLRLAEGGMRAAPPEASYAAPAASRAAGSLVALTIDPEQVTVEPGKVVTMTLHVLNQQQQVDHFTALVENLPASWVTLPAEPLRLAPGDTGTITLRLAPPRDSTSLSGTHVFDVRVISRANPAVSAHASATCVVQPFRALGLELQPSTFVNAGDGQVTLTNAGNSPESVSLAVADPTGTLISPATNQPLTLQAGQRQQVRLPIRARGRRPLMGNPSTSAFQVRAMAGDSPLATAQGNLTVKPILPAWAIPLLTTLVLLLFAGVALAYNNAQKTQSAQQTAVALSVNLATATAEAVTAVQVTQTAQAVAAQQTATAQAQATSNLQAATVAAATATAQYLASDEDTDSLTVSQELAYGTNPQNVDTDGDTLPDGAEVSSGTSPINKDTDGDGVQDNVDPSPGELPTLTPEPSPTATSTLTPSPEPTPLHSFAAGSERAFTVVSVDVGTINKVCLKHDNTGPEPDWFVARASVDGGSGAKPFTFERWLATDKADGNLEACLIEGVPTATFALKQPALRHLPALIATSVSTQAFQPVLPVLTIMPLLHSYSVEVVTGNAEGAGTSAQVWIKIGGDKDETDWLLLE